METVNRWMVIWTRPAVEFDVVSRLRGIGLDAIVPAIKKERQAQRWTRPGRNFGRAKPPRETYLAPAFPRYILFAATDRQPVWQKAAREDGVSMIVRQAGNRERPGLLPHAVVAMLRGPNGDGIIQDLTSTVDEITRFARDAKIVVTSGPFANFPGVVVGHDGKNVRVLLSILGGEREATIGPDSIAELQVA